MRNELYCKIYLDSDQAHDAVIASIRDAVSGNVTRRTISSTTLQIDVVESEDFDSANRSGDDRFLFYRYLDIEPRPGVSRLAYVASVQGLLRRLRELVVDAVPACDFEDELTE